MQVHMLKFAEKSHFLRSYNGCKKIRVSCTTLGLNL